MVTSLKSQKVVGILASGNQCVGAEIISFGAANPNCGSSFSSGPSSGQFYKIP
jgi:hypothetical protein